MSTRYGWDEALVAAGFTDRRSAKGGASWTALAQAVGVHTSTLTAMRDGTRDTDGATIDKVAEALHLDVLMVAEWVGKARTERTPYYPPKVADLLDRDERAAVDRMIELLARSKRGGTNATNAAAGEKTAGEGEPRVEKPLTLAERRRRRMLEQGQPAEEAADDRGDKGDKL